MLGDEGVEGGGVVRVEGHGLATLVPPDDLLGRADHAIGDRELEPGLIEQVTNEWTGDEPGAQQQDASGFRHVLRFPGNGGKK